MRSSSGSGRRWRGSTCRSLPEGQRNSLSAALARYQKADQAKVRQVEQDAHAEGGGIETEVIVQFAGEPAAERHARHAHEEKGRDSPRGFRGREQLTQRDDIRRDDAREAETERGGDSEQSDLALR